jgi:predicted nucleic acid-binding protein
LIDQQKIEAYTSPLIFANLHYLLKKLTSNASALKSLRKLKTLINILSVDERVIDQALNSEFNDFEDAIQYFTAVNNGINILLTRNKSVYKKSKITISTSEEFIKSLYTVKNNK